MQLALTFENFTTPATYIVNVYGLNNSFGGDGWSESTITWNNAPANLGLDTLTGDATHMGTITVNNGAQSGTVYSLDDPDLLSFINEDTDGLVTLILISDTANQATTVAYFASNDHLMYGAPELLLLAQPHAGTMIVIK